MQALRGIMCQSARVRRRARRVLLADDDPESLEGLRSLLEAWGYEVEIARDGRAALDQVPVVRPSVVITDVVMPRMSGLELLQAIRRDRPGIPVIVMTAHGNTDTRRNATAMGAVAYLPKPIDTSQLKSVLRSALPEAGEEVDQ